MFFLCSISDISNICKETKMLLYADDIVMYKAVSDDERFHAMHSFKQDIERMVWCQRNRLSINVKKTKVVLFIYTQIQL